MMPLWTTASQVGGVRMGVALGRPAMGRPAGVTDADRAAERLALEPRLERAKLAFARGAASSTPCSSVATPAEIVAAVFEALERIDQLPRNRLMVPENSDDPAQSAWMAPLLTRCGLAAAGQARWKSKRVSPCDISLARRHVTGLITTFSASFRLRFLPTGFHRRKRFAQPSLTVCLRARSPARAGRHILGDDRSGADIGTIADLDRRDQRRSWSR